MSEDFTARATCECYYQFENSDDLGLDKQGQIALTNNNTVTQSATLPSGTYASPSAANSADFEVGSTQSLSANHDDSAEIDNLTAYTALAWLKPESVPSQLNIYSKATGFTDGFISFIAGSGVTYRFYFAGTNYAEGITTLLAGTWYFFATSYSQADDEQRVYRGLEETQVVQDGAGQSLTDATASTTGGFKIGGYAWQTGTEWDGLICEFAVFSEELTLAEIQEVQEDGIEGTVTTVPQVAQQILLGNDSIVTFPAREHIVRL